MNLGLAVTRSAIRRPDAVAAFDDERSMTYAELDDRSNRLANALLEGVATGGVALAAGDRVALLVANRIEVCEVLAGITKARGTYVGLNFRLAADELAHIMANAEPRLLISEDAYRDVVAPVAGSAGIPWISVDDVAYADLLSSASPAPPRTLHEVRPDDDACIVYTSGTTGTPKGVWFDHARILQHATVAALEYGIDADTRYLVAIPHNSSVNITFAPGFTMGAAIGFSDSRGFDPERYARQVSRHRATHTYLVPTQLYRLLDHLPATSTQLETLSTVGYGAAPMAPDKIAQLVERFGPRFIQLYGMAEIASIGTMLRKSDHALAAAEDPRIFGSAGRPSYAVDVRVVDDDRRDVPQGERGEVIFGTPHAMKGYYRDPERTGRTLIDGWVHSGDIALYDDRGYLYVVDRKKDLIIRGGYNIAPTEVEAVLHRHPDVLEVGVIGIPDPEWGEAVMAVVALRPGAAVDADTLLAFVTDDATLSSVKRPERIELVDSLPKNAVGKIAKGELRARFWQGDRQV